MVAIQPVTLWIQGTTKSANVFILSIVTDDLSSRAVFYYRLGSETPTENQSTNLEILLKARAYDIIAALENLQRELTTVNEKISSKTLELQKINEDYERGALDANN